MTGQKSNKFVFTPFKGIDLAKLRQIKVDSRTFTDQIRTITSKIWCLAVVFLKFYRFKIWPGKIIRVINLFPLIVNTCHIRLLMHATQLNKLIIDLSTYCTNSLCTYCTKGIHKIVVLDSSLGHQHLMNSGFSPKVSCMEGVATPCTGGAELLAGAWSVSLLSLYSSHYHY